MPHELGGMLFVLACCDSFFLSAGLGGGGIAPLPAHRRRPRPLRRAVVKDQTCHQGFLWALNMFSAYHTQGNCDQER